MDFEIIEKPIRFTLYGCSSTDVCNLIGEIGLQLMNEVWRTVKEGNLITTGINHWVYLKDGSMFVGVELQSQSDLPTGLAKLQFTMDRYLKHVHIGAYHALPKQWQTLKLALVDLGESIGPHSLEIYGHHCDDESKLETTILINLEPK